MIGYDGCYMASSEGRYVSFPVISRFWKGFLCDKRRAVEEKTVLKFETYSEAWLDFILTCRSGRDTSDYDIVIGGVANDKVFNTVELYFDGLIDKGEAIKRLRYEKPNLQICFRSQAAVEELLSFEGSEKL